MSEGEELSGRVVVVTGGSGLLGSSVVDVFSNAGATVATIDRSGGGGNSFKCDVTNEQDVVSCFAQIVSTFGAVHALIHTVGTWGMSPFLETSHADWNRMMKINLDSAMLCFREALRHMDDSGRLIAIASRQGADGGVAQQGAYSASKAGVIRLVEAVAAEFGGRGITANAVAPYQIASGANEPGTQPEDIARVCHFLTGESAQTINGTVLRMYGG